MKVASPGESTGGPLQEEEACPLSPERVTGWQCVKHPGETAPGTGPGCEPLAPCSRDQAKPFHSPLDTDVTAACSLHTACLWPGCPHRSVIMSASPMWPADLLFPLTPGSHCTRCHRDWSPASHLNSGGCGLRLPQWLQASSSLAKPVHASAFCWADLPFSSEILPSSNFVLTWLFSFCSKISYRISLYVTVTLFSSLTLLYVKFLLLKLLWGFSLLTGPKLPSSLNVWYFKRQDFEALWFL